MTLSIRGLGTAVPQHTMSQDQAVQMAQTICQADPRQRRILNVLYRHASVQNRHTCLPYQTALAWLAGDSSGQDLEPSATNGEPVTTQELANNGPPRIDRSLLEEHSSKKVVQADTPAPPESAPTLGPTTRQRMDYYEQHAFELASQAVAAALKAGTIDPAEITHLVTVSCTGFYSPGVDVQLMEHCGLRPTTERVHVGFMGCHGAINGLRVSKAFGSDCPGAVVLLCAVELCCLHYRFQWDPQRFLGNALFADGAGVLVLGESQQPSGLKVLATGSCLLPDSTDAMTWRIGDHGFEMTLSSRVPDCIKEHLRPWLTEWLHQQGSSLEAIRGWAVHPGGPRILDAVQESLSLSHEDLVVSREVLAQLGNMSSPTVLFILQRLQQQGVSGPFLLLGFGPGLVAEVALLA